MKTTKTGKRSDSGEQPRRITKRTTADTKAISEAQAAAAAAVVADYFKDKRTHAEAKAALRVMNAYTRQYNQRTEMLRAAVRSVELLERRGDPKARTLAARLAKEVTRRR